MSRGVARLEKVGKIWRSQRLGRACLTEPRYSWFATGAVDTSGIHRAPSVELDAQDGSVQRLNHSPFDGRLSIPWRAQRFVLCWSHAAASPGPTAIAVVRGTVPGAFRCLLRLRGTQLRPRLGRPAGWCLLPHARIASTRPRRQARAGRPVRRPRPQAGPVDVRVQVHEHVHGRQQSRSERPSRTTTR